MPGFINAEGLFNGDRLRRCSNLAQLHFPRLFLASDGFGRLELNYAKILRAYVTFHPVPSEIEVHAWLQEYVQNFLLFVYLVDGQLWGQWDAKAEYLPRYKTAADRRSPIPPDSDLKEWRHRYRSECKAFPKSFETLQNISPRVVLSCVELSCVEERNTQNLARVSKPLVSDLNGRTSQRFEEFWGKYPRKQRRDFAARNFVSYVTVDTEAQAFACLDRYLRSEEVSRNVVMNPDKWLYEQHCGGWQGDWPARKKTIDEIIEEMPDDQ